MCKLVGNVQLCHECVLFFSCSSRGCIDGRQTNYVYKCVNRLQFIFLII